ncbi:MAG: hypothetical protein FJX25_13905 [Alphaproteobacteria bacterium]|nr:hypothetical protein [Alphaproteobacteria bacterium]
MTDRHSNTRAGWGTSRSELQQVSRRAFLHSAAAIPALCVIGLGQAQAAALRPFSTKVIQSGHSLTDPIVPVLDAMVAAAGQQDARARVIDRSSIPGSPMEWRWDHRTDDQPDARRDIAKYELLVITERVSLSNTVPWHNSGNMAVQWFTHAWTEGNDGAGAETILYATWVDISSGPDAENPYNDPEAHIPFRERLPLEMERWQAIADQVNAERPAGSPPMRVIPGPLIMAAVHDAIAAGQAPGLEGIEDLFGDTIHPNAWGAYLISLAHLAVIYGFDPRDLAVELAGLEVPAPETADWMKQLVHDVLRDYPDAGYPAAI